LEAALELVDLTRVAAEFLGLRELVIGVAVLASHLRSERGHHVRGGFFGGDFDEAAYGGIELDVALCGERCACVDGHRIFVGARERGFFCERKCVRDFVVGRMRARDESVGERALIFGRHRIGERFAAHGDGVLGVVDLEESAAKTTRRMTACVTERTRFFVTSRGFGEIILLACGVPFFERGRSLRIFGAQLGDDLRFELGVGVRTWSCTRDSNGRKKRRCHDPLQAFAPSRHARAPPRFRREPLFETKSHAFASNVTKRRKLRPNRARESIDHRARFSDRRHPCELSQRRLHRELYIATKLRNRSRLCARDSLFCIRIELSVRPFRKRMRERRVTRFIFCDPRHRLGDLAIGCVHPLPRRHHRRERLAHAPFDHIFARDRFEITRLLRARAHTNLGRRRVVFASEPRHRSRVLHFVHF
jgi:hypothetical protein